MKTLDLPLLFCGIAAIAAVGLASYQINRVQGLESRVQELIELRDEQALTIMDLRDAARGDDQ